jgi:hypothetical protein
MSYPYDDAISHDEAAQCLSPAFEIDREIDSQRRWRRERERYGGCTKKIKVVDGEDESKTLSLPLFSRRFPAENGREWHVRAASATDKAPALDTNLCTQAPTKFPPSLSDSEVSLSLVHYFHFASSRSNSRERERERESQVPRCHHQKRGLHGARPQLK